MKTGTGKRIGHGQSLYYDTRSQLAVCINCLGPAQVRGAIDSVFGVTEVDELWPTITRSNRTRNDSHAAVSRFIIEAFTTRTGLPAPTSAQTGLQDLLKTYQERIEIISEVYLAQFYGQALLQGNQRASAVIDLANVDVTEFLAALQAQSPRDLNQKVKLGCNILGHETEDLFLARVIWEMAAEWLISHIYSQLVLYRRNDICLPIDVDKSARMIHTRLQEGLTKTYGAQSALFQSVLDGVERCAGLSSTFSRVGGGFSLAAATILTLAPTAFLAIPLAGVAVWKPETVGSAHRWCNGVALSVDRQARSWTYAFGSRCGLLKRVPLVSG